MLEEQHRKKDERSISLQSSLSSCLEGNAFVMNKSGHSLHKAANPTAVSYFSDRVPYGHK